MALRNARPLVQYDNHRDGISVWRFPEASMRSVVECCDHYCEKMRTYCETDRWVSKRIVQRAMDRVRDMAIQLFDEEKREIAQAKRSERMARELEALFAGEGLLECDAGETNPTLACYGDGSSRFSVKAPAAREDIRERQRAHIQGMKSELIDLEAAYLVRTDTVESLRRQIAMLERSLPDGLNRNLF